MFNESNLTLINSPEKPQYPDLNTISEEAYLYLYQQYSQIPNLESRRSEKWMGLKSLGLSDKRIEKMCKPIEHDREEIYRQIGKETLRERRRWKREAQFPNS